MAFGSPREEQAALSEINVTPLVDVMLVLLVVFIVTAPLLTQSVGVNLPKTVAAAPPPPRPVTLVSLDSTGQLYLDREKLDSAALADRRRHACLRGPPLTWRIHPSIGQNRRGDAIVPAVPLAARVYAVRGGPVRRPRPQCDVRLRRLLHRGHARAAG